MNVANKAVLCLLSLACASAWASSAPTTTTLNVVGAVIPNTCDISIADGGAYTFGDITPGMLDQTNATTLTAQSKTMTIQCGTGQNASVAVSVADNSTALLPAGSDATQFGLGNGSSSYGSYTLTLKTPKIDNVDQSFLTTTNGGTAWTNAGSTPVAMTRSTGANRVGFVSGTGTTLTAGNVFTAQLEVAPTILSLTDLGGITSDVTLSGSATVTLYFM
ncbi:MULTISPECIES: DUF1120 domain-containing protein [unclassified Paludibacterium]|uniref:DUF1120 domain-containing protein n=1 Tax=unclassified Paludibacterium TaxID=2618429 RepID=UPI001C04E66C|nr:DUF1120 domain-containing protein [Paludibacterium sp. B53371]BEV71860.1 hypothetical protein THUN1379_13420 [Paludibacterium sp. THUN1379]